MGGIFRVSWWLTIVMKTKSFTVLANQRAFTFSRNSERNLKNNSGNNSVHNLIRGIPQNLFCFHRNFCLRTVQSWAMIQITDH